MDGRIDRVEIAVLGPVEVRDGVGEILPVAGARLRTLVVLLALDANREVTADRLVDGVWGTRRPRPRRTRCKRWSRGCAGPCRA